MNREAMLMYPDEYRVMFEFEDDYWWYRGLRVLLKRLLAQYGPADQASAMILDVGCGTGGNLRVLQSHGHAIGVDISEQAIAFCRARGIPESRAFLASADELPFPNSIFDLAVSFDVICNFADDAPAFGEIARVLRPGAPFIVGLPAYQWLWSVHDIAVGHRRRYDAQQLRQKISMAGFEIERITYANLLLMPLIATVRLMCRRVKGNGHAVHSDLVPLPRIINASLAALFIGEMHAASRVNLPYGLSVIAVARKRRSTTSEL